MIAEWCMNVSIAVRGHQKCGDRMRGPTTEEEQHHRVRREDLSEGPMMGHLKYQDNRCSRQRLTDGQCCKM